MRAPMDSRVEITIQIINAPRSCCISNFKCPLCTLIWIVSKHCTYISVEFGAKLVIYVPRKQKLTESYPIYKIRHT